MTCNGIGVAEPLPWDEGGGWDPLTYRIDIEPLEVHDLGTIACPSVGVFDSDGKLPLVLQRTSLIGGRYPFHTNLLDDVSRDMVAKILGGTPKARPFDAVHWRALRNLEYPLYYSDDQSLLPIMICQDGLSVFDPYFLNKLEISRILLVPPFGSMDSQLAFIEDLFNLKNNLPAAVIPLGLASQATEFTTLLRIANVLRFLAKNFKVTGSRILINPALFKSISSGEFDMVEFLTNAKKGPSSSQAIRRLHKSFSDPDKVIKFSDKLNLIHEGKCPDDCFNFKRISVGSFPSFLIGLTEVYIADSQAGDISPISAIAKAWKEIIKAPIVPYDPTRRRTNLNSVFDTLSSYMGKSKSRNDKARKTTI